MKVLSTKVTIVDRRNPSKTIGMSLEEYIYFIKEQATILNIIEGKKSLTTRISHPGLKDPGPYPVNNPIGGVNLGKPNGDTSNTYTVQKPTLSPTSNTEILDNLAKNLNKEIRKNRGINQC